MSVTLALAKHMADNGRGTVGTSLLTGGLRDGDAYPDQQVAFTLYDGRAIETYAAAEPQVYVQAMLRGNPDKYLQFEDWAMGVWQFLVGIRRVTVTGLEIEGTPVPDVFLQAVRPNGVVNLLGQDASMRRLASINLEVTT